MTQALVVRVRAPFASFRRPLDHNFQRSLPLPPPTTLMGIAGAALGLSPEQLWGAQSPLHGIAVQVLARKEFGKATDMWTLLKAKSGKMVRSPYLRELLANPEYDLLYKADPTTLTTLKNAFENPTYPLSLGREDELLIVESANIEPIETPSPPFTFRGTILVGDPHALGVRLDLLSFQTSEPIYVERHPIAFCIEKKGRTPLRYETLTFVPPTLALQLQTAPSEYEIGAKDGYHFVWIPMQWTPC